MARVFGASLATLLLAWIPASAQSVQGRVLDGKSDLPLPGALVELRDTTNHVLIARITTPSGRFQFVAPEVGRYLLRVVAIGYTPRPISSLQVGVEGLSLPDLTLTPMSVRLPDLIVVARQRFCGKTGFSDEVFSQLLESARSALQVIEATIQSRQIGFQVAIVNSRILYGSVNNFITADTVVRNLAAWPVRSVPADTLQRYGFGREKQPGVEGSREYYGPDPQVLFSDWFLAGHCFTLDKVKKGSDTLHVRFAPLRKGKKIDIRGELMLDAHNLSLQAMTFGHTNLPNWMPEEASGGEMQFYRLSNGLWVSRAWAIWAPIAGLSWNGDGMVPSTAGLAELRGMVTRMFVDTTENH